MDTLTAPPPVAVNGTPTNPPPEIPETFEEIKKNMTIYATDMIAGAIIAEATFPAKSVQPRFFPLPFANFGHFYLFDNRRFLQIIYQTSMEMKVKYDDRRSWEPGAWGITVFVLGIILSVISGSDQWFLLSIITSAIAISIYVWLLNKRIKKANKLLAEYKADTLRQLLECKWEPNPEAPVPDRLIELLDKCGDGNIAAKESPVLVMFSDEQPFPGFGRLQLDNKFICRPKDLDLASATKENDLFAKITAKLRQSLAASGIPNVGFGKVIALNYSSIGIDSPWLDEQKVPMLYKEVDEVGGLYQLDGKSSARLYFVVEVLFPDYDSACCFFIRPFKASNSAGCQIAMTTIGPPVSREAFILNRWMRFDPDEDDDVKPTPNNKSMFANVVTKESTTDLELEQIRNRLKDKFHIPLTGQNIKDIDPLQDEGYDETRIAEKVEEITDSEAYWPGRYTYFKFNIREQKSVTMGGDFFGYPELTGSLGTIYDQLSRTILEVIEEQGFDITNYKDKEGKFSINAESIDKLVIGEVINMKKDDDNNSGTKPGGATNSGGTTTKEQTATKPDPVKTINNLISGSKN